MSLFFASFPRVVINMENDMDFIWNKCGHASPYILSPNLVQEGLEAVRMMLAASS